MPQVAADGGPAGSPPALHAQLIPLREDVSCDACAWLVLQVEGGTPPYAYEWSEPGLSGPGPQHVCPTEPVTYSVRVTDHAGLGAMDRTQTTTVRAAVPCTATPPLSAAPSGATAPGCFSAASAPPMTCASDALGLPTISSTELPRPLAADQSHALIVDIGGLPLSLSMGFRADLYLSSAPCGTDLAVGTISVGSEPVHRTFCVDSGDTYGYLVAVAHADSNPIPLALVNTGVNVCSGCDDNL